METDLVETKDNVNDDNEKINYLGDNHNGILFEMSDLPKMKEIEFPDDFFEVTKDDMVYVLNDLQKQQQENRHKMFETKQMREKRERERMLRYKSVVVRICFPNDKLVYQAIFKPDDTVASVLKIASNYVKTNNFYLFTTPPKCRLKAESTLYSCGLVPAALIHFGSDSSTLVIKEEFKNRITSYKLAAKLAKDSRTDSKTTNSLTMSKTEESLQKNDCLKSKITEKMSVSGQSQQKIPKWFKPNK
ncbi:tether containing UBX domain for GLUT4-like [Oppia nitens]|uniref:tether containing UBX domain for GLUT4-like n=1 Tax=Oppia nitens TaxID=1686743 RepID=UPI0023D9DE2A|nr:tether containing UBX domain for GLUT4-like [Oppia nitens]